MHIVKHACTLSQEQSINCFIWFLLLTFTSIALLGLDFTLLPNTVNYRTLCCYCHLNYPAIISDKRYKIKGLCFCNMVFDSLTFFLPTAEIKFPKYFCSALLFQFIFSFQRLFFIYFLEENNNQRSLQIALNLIMKIQVLVQNLSWIRNLYLSCDF